MEKIFKLLLSLVLLFLVGCGSSSSSETIKENETSTEAQTKEEEPAVNHPVGTFILTDGTADDGSSMKESIDMMAAMNTYSNLIINDDGKATLDLFEDKYDLVFDDKTFTVNGNSFNYKYDGTKVTFDMNGSEMIFTDENSLTQETTSSSEQSSSSASLSMDDFDIQEYKRESYDTTLYYLVVTNKSDVPVELYANATAYDASNAMLGADDASIDIIGPGEKSLMYFYFDSVTGVDHIDYSLQYNTDVYYDPVISGLKVEEALNGSVLILAIKNELDYPAQFVEAYALFFDANNNLVDVTENYATDNDSEIKPGATQTIQLETYEPFDHVEWVLTGRHSKW